MRWLLALALFVIGCGSTSNSMTASPPPQVGMNRPAQTQPTQPAAPATESVVLHVKGLGCPLCATNVKKSLEKVRGVQETSVDLGRGIVTVRGEAPLQETDLKNAVISAGFTLEAMEPARSNR